jgi:NAD(P)-dependent dehydrogenase (short-subunit alcohol dehydrogenase family)
MVREHGRSNVPYRTHARPEFCDDRNRGGAGQAIGADANRRWVDQTPLGRLGRPEDVADLVLYLTSGGGELHHQPRSAMSLAAC